MENRKFGNRSIPSLFRIFRFAEQISFSRNTPIKEKRERKTRAYAHEGENRKTRLRDGGWEGNPTGARETGAVAMRPVVLFRAVLCFCRFFVVPLWQKR